MWNFLSDDKQIANKEESPTLTYEQQEEEYESFLKREETELNKAQETYGKDSPEYTKVAWEYIDEGIKQRTAMYKAMSRDLEENPLQNLLNSDN